MPEYVIFTDATVDLTDAFVESEKIGILPMEYTMDGATYTYCRDWKEEQYKDFYAQLRAGKVATTSQITPLDVYKRQGFARRRVFFWNLP